MADSQSDTSSDEESFEDVPVIPGDETPWQPALSEENRRCLKELYSDLGNGRLTEEKIRENMEYLNMDIIVACYATGHSCHCQTTFELERAEILDQHLEMIMDGCCPCVKRLLAEGPVPVKNIQNASKRLIHLAAEMENSVKTVQHLMNSDCDCSARLKVNGLTPILVAAYHNHVDLVTFWKQKGFGVGEMDKEICFQLLVKAAYSHEIAMFQTLLSLKTIDINYHYPGSTPLLILFIRMDLVDFIEPILRTGHKAECENRGVSALQLAVHRKLYNVVKLLISYGANVKSPTAGDSLLVRQVYTGDVEMVKILLEAGADANEIVTNDGQNTPLILASFEGPIEIVKELLKHKADVSQPNSLKYTPIHIAAWNGHVDIVKHYLEVGASHDMQTSDKNTPLALAAHGNHVNVMKVLLPLGCDVNNADKDLDTPLHYSAYNGDTEAMMLLMEYGADPDALNRFNCSVLWNAVYQKKKEAVKILLVKNVKLEICSVGIDQHAQADEVVCVYNTPQSPLWVAVERDCPEIALLLVTAGYNIYSESWLVNGEFPESTADSRLATVLTKYVHTPPRLIALCRNFFRRYFGLQLSTKIKQMDIPETLKNYLILKDLASR